jgi:hypothetical protein
MPFCVRERSQGSNKCIFGREAAKILLLRMLLLLRMREGSFGAPDRPMLWGDRAIKRERAAQTRNPIGVSPLRVFAPVRFSELARFAEPAQAALLAAPGGAPTRAPVPATGRVANLLPAFSPTALDPTE